MYSVGLPLGSNSVLLYVLLEGVWETVQMGFPVLRWGCRHTFKAGFGGGEGDISLKIDRCLGWFPRIDPFQAGGMSISRDDVSYKSCDFRLRHLSGTASPANDGRLT